MAVVNPLHGNPVSRVLARLDARRLGSIMVRPDGAGLTRIAEWLAASVEPAVERLYGADAHGRSRTGRGRAGHRDEPRPGL